MTTQKINWDLFQEWYNISGNIYLADRDQAWYVWQTVIAFNEKLKDKESKDQ